MAKPYQNEFPKWYTFYVEATEGEYRGVLFVADSPGTEGNFDDNTHEITHRDWQQPTKQEVIDYFLKVDGYKIRDAGNYLILCPDSE